LDANRVGVPKEELLGGKYERRAKTEKRSPTRTYLTVGKGMLGRCGNGRAGNIETWGDSWGIVFKKYNEK